MPHHTKEKGDLGVAKTAMRLTELGYSVLTPTFTEHLPFDLAAYKEGVFLRIQCKFRAGGKIQPFSIWSDSNGVHKKALEGDEFDFYSVYLPDVDQVVFAPITKHYMRLRTSVPNSATPFWWYEDFLTPNPELPEKRTYKEFGKSLERSGNPRPGARRAERPEPEELARMVKELGYEAVGRKFGVSGNAVRKWEH